jgi:hypothetical protein
VCKAPQRKTGIQMTLQEVQNSFKSFWNLVQRRNFFEHALIRKGKTRQKAKWQNFIRLLSRPLRNRTQGKLLLAPTISLLGSNNGRGKIQCDFHQLQNSLQNLNIQTHGFVKILLVELFYP